MVKMVLLSIGWWRLITLNGKPVNIKSQSVSDAKASQWAKEACNRIFSHYTPEEMELMRKQNG